MTNLLYVERSESIATVVFNRSDKKNSFSLAMFKQLGELLTELEKDSKVKLLILKGVDETAFSSGADITEFLENRFSAQKA
ncbi:enoyl-CoA hydratase/isomerase family protein, partial [Psychrobacillus psychrotolerans]